MSWKCQRNRGGASFLVRFHFGRDHAIAHDRVFILLLPCCHTQLDGRSNSMWGRNIMAALAQMGESWKCPCCVFANSQFIKNRFNVKILWLGPDNSSVKLVDLELGHTLALDSKRSLLLLTTSPRWGGGGGRLKEIGRKLRAWCCHGEFGQTQTGLGGWPEKPACLDNYTPKLLLVLPPSNTTKMAHSAVLV